MTEILKCPLQPDVEPRVRGRTVKWVNALSRDGAGVEGPVADSPEKAIELWNAWMQPLHDLKAENERLLEKIAKLEAQVAFQQGLLHQRAGDSVRFVKRKLPRSGDEP